MVSRTPEASFFAHSFQGTSSNFDDFVRFREYRDENLALFVKALPYIPQESTIVAVACGNGLESQLIVPVIDATLRKATIFNLDPDPHAIAKAKEDAPSSARCQLYFIKGFAQGMDELLKGKIPTQGVDVITLFNSIHEIPAQDQFSVIEACVRNLRSRGVFIPNSAFTTVAQEDNPMAWNRRIHAAAVELGGTLNKKKAGLLIRSPQEYEQMYEAAGLVVVYKEIVSVMLQPETLRAIARYSGYCEGVFRRYDFDPMPTPKYQQEVLETHLGSGPLVRKWVRWICQKP